MLKKTAAMNTIGYDGTAEAEGRHARRPSRSQTPAFVSGPNVLGKTSIVPEHLWKDIDPTTDVDGEADRHRAYMLGKFKPQAFTYEANPEYWGGAPKVKTIRFLSLSGNKAGADGIAAGTIDWQTGPIPDIQNIDKQFPSYDAHTVRQNQMVLLTCSNADAGLQGPADRPGRAAGDLLRRSTATSSTSWRSQSTASTISPTLR